MITRLAPTPSGFLHEGNAANLLLVSWLAAAAQGQVALRIDDMDASRYRPAYVDDVFSVLEWLDIPWHIGPTDPRDFEQRHSQRLRTEQYRSELGRLTSSEHLEVYACRCSRKQLRDVGSMSCVGDCRHQGRELVPGESALRVHVPRGTTVTVDGRSVDLAAEAGDFVVWRRDDVPAYHLVSVVEDRELNVSHVVRGSDLVASTAAQLFLAPHLDAVALTRATFVHHALALDDQGLKLSKSQLAAGPMERSVVHRRRVYDLARKLGEPVGIGPVG